MTRPWTRADALRDAADVITEAAQMHTERPRGEDHTGEVWSACEGWVGVADVRSDTGPCRECYPPVPAHLRAPDPWGDGPLHHPTRFDLPIAAEPPF